MGAVVGALAVEIIGLHLIVVIVLVVVILGSLVYMFSVNAIMRALIAPQLLLTENAVFAAKLYCRQAVVGVLCDESSKCSCLTLRREEVKTQI